MARYQEIADEIASLIARGTLRVGQRIPSVRKASTQHKVSAGTVLQAFDQLEARGLIEARPQSGYYVRAQHSGFAPEPQSTAPQSRAVQLDVSELVFGVLEQIKHRELVPLGSAFPSPELFPLARLNRMAAAAARRQKTWASVDDLPPGNAELRHQIALRYLESGCAVAPDDIVITCGALEAINLSLQAVTRPGDTVAIESPTFYSTLQAIERLGLRAVEIATHPRTGIELTALEAALKSHNIKACVLVTTFQNPLGACMPDENKATLIKLLIHHDVPLIEDDVYAELYFGGERPRPAKAFDKSGLVLHCGSFSKCLAPGYRVGWVAAGRYRTQVERIKLMTTLSTASLPQAAIAAFLKHGAYERHLRHLRHTLASQCQEMMRAVSQHFPEGCRMTRPEGGYMLWIELPKSVDALQLHQLALDQGISIAPGPIFSAQRKYRNCIRLNFGYPWTPRVEKAVKTLGRLASTLA
ncbi:MAG: PLP-dependent aminotransferase family protein [Pseudomonadota bacterium]